MASRAGDEQFQSAETTVQLVLDHDQNRRMLAQGLAGDHTVIDTIPDDFEDASFDLCIIDAPSFEAHHESLRTKKRDAEPAFLPYLFLTDSQQVERLPEAVWDVVDEVLTTPLAPAELAHRLENLLERRRLSLELKRRKERSEERFKALFDTAPDPIVVTSSNGAISEVNESFARTVGASPEDLVGQSITDIGFAPSDTVERVLLRVVESESDESSESDSVQLDVGDGESMVTELNADIVTALGEASERIGIFRDVTEREQREADLRQQNERLEEFASTIAHDLRNPLSIAQGHLKVARNSGDAESFDAVVQAHDRMEQLIDEILTLARQGQLVMNPESVSLEEIAHHAWKHVETETATLTIESDQEILADEGRLSECFENLFRNAVEHGGDSVSVRVGSIDTADNRGFYVEDDGPGIPSRDRDDVFEAGYTDSDKGTGFGLSIVQQIVEGHDWDISVTEGEEGGARFEITGVA